MKKQLLIVGALVLTISACSKSGSGGGASPIQGKNPGPGNQTDQAFKEAYQFVLNGCDTGKHQFASTNTDEVKRQLCEALQDDSLNGSCAEPLRNEFFSKKCSGYSWTPKYEAADPSAPQSSTNPQAPAIDFYSRYVNEDKIRNSLKFALVDKYDLAPSLATQQKPAVTQLAEDMMSCGISYLGPKCLDYITAMGSYGGSLDQIDGKYIFYSELTIKDTGFPMAFKFTVDQIEPTVKIGKLEVFQVAKARVGQSVADYLKDNANLLPLMSVTLADDWQKSAWQRMQKPRDIRELYHLSKALIEASFSANTYQQTKTKLADAIQKNASVIVQSADIQYQEEVLLLINNGIQIGGQSLIEICDGLLNSKSENIKQIAATIVMNAQPERTDLKPLVLSALNNSRWDIRKKAILALVKIKKTPAEECQLLSKIEDQDEDVRKEAISADAKINVGESHFDTVKKLASSENWKVRIEAAKLLGRIGSTASTAELIQRMDDPDSDVRKQIVTQIGQKTLTAANVADLSKELASSNWAVRSEAVKFLGKISANEATLVLISKMDDQDNDVRNLIVAQLSRRTLTNDSVALLKKNFDSQNWSVRRDAAKLLGQVKSADSLAALQDQLLNETDSDVKSQIIASIKAEKN